MSIILSISSCKGGNLMQHDHATKKMLHIVLCPVCYFSVSTYWLSIFLDFKKEWKKATTTIINLGGL